jgi:predicted enzyme related to lactoylglutathione lyase
MSLQRRQLLRVLTGAFGSGFILPHSEFAMAAQTPAQPASPAPPPKAAVKDESGTQKERVAGIGGFFFRAHDPKALGKWYQENLGIGFTPAGESGTVWHQEAGETAFTPFSEKSTYFGDPSKVWMVNFRVHDLDKLVVQLKAAAIEVKVDPQSYPYGRFASLHDPEGNPIQLWQPA